MEQKKIDDILSNMNHIIETKPYTKHQLVEFKELIKNVHDIQNKDLLRASYNNRGIDLICLICKHNKTMILQYLLQESHIMHYFTSENKDMETKYREDAFYCTICSNQFRTTEMLYDHWTGDLHWLGHKKEYKDFDVENVSQIHNSLRNALERYENRTLNNTKKEIDQNMMFNVQSLIALSEFQRDLYGKLNELKRNLEILGDNPNIIRIRETCAIRDMILDMIDCYEYHTNKFGNNVFQKSVFKDTSEFNEYSKFMETPKDTSKLLHKTYLYVFFEAYFRKLDYNICLLILDNLHSLKLRLIMPEDSYQKLENKVYHFIYHLKSNWNLYIPKKRNIKTKTFPGKHNNINCYFLLKYNVDTFMRGLHIIYLERRDFESTLQLFKNELKNRNVEENLRKDKIELPNEEINCLTLIPELRDIYSLKKMSRHIEYLHSIDLKYSSEYVCLLVERTLQIIGEFLKSTNETLHLQASTEALAEVEISVEVVNDLKTLRDLLCHVKDGELLKRIEMETNSSHIFKLILMELKLIKNNIDEVITIYKPLMEKCLILNGLSLIEKRKNEMPDVSNNFFSAIRRVRLFPQNEPYCELFWAPIGFAEEFSAEIVLLVEHSLQLELKLTLVKEKIHNNLTRKFSMYKNKINSSLQKIVEVKKNWQNIVKSLKDKIPSITLLDYPNENDANRIKTYSKKVDFGDASLNQFVEENLLFAYAEIHWKFIKNVIEFIISKAETKHCTPVDLENITRELKTLSYKNNDMEKIVGDYLNLIEEKLELVPNMKYQNQCPKFKGIKELRRKLTMANFLIKKEKEQLIDTLRNIKKVNIKQNQKIEVMIDKIDNDEAIPKKECKNFIATMNLDEKAKKNLINLVMGHKRDPLHPWCLSKRIALLKEIIKEQSVVQLVTRYKLDKTFRPLLEVLVFDIFAIFGCTKNNEIVKKSGKLLTEINLRNFLIHGSPLLEIVGNVLDSNDLATELITKAVDLLKEEISINALCALKDSNFDFTLINSNLLSPEELALVTEFKTSARWEDYLIFIPELMQTRKKRKKITKTDNNLLEAVKKKDSLLVQRRIVEGGNVNLVDDSKRALIHYAAAIKENVDVMKVLLNNGADVNIRSKYNMSALHFAAMNGFIAAVDLLLKNGADYSALDDRGRTPIYLADQRQHVHVRDRLAQAMQNGINN